MVRAVGPTEHSPRRNLAERQVAACNARIYMLTVCMLTACMLTGCRSQAYQQVYSEKMAGEIRRLEDSIYALEYENEVLQQKLTRMSDRGNRAQTDQNGLVDSRADNPRSNNRTSEPPQEADPRSGRPDPPRARSKPDQFDDPLGDELEIDMGEPMGSGSNVRPPTLDPGSPPPIAPVPPRESDLVPPPIDLGEPQPPGANNGTQPRPPGQIQLPGEVRKLYNEPAESVNLRQEIAGVEIYVGLSGVYHLNEDSETDGLHLVFATKDSAGLAVDPSHPISVVVLDPARTGEDARLGRWDFTPAEASEHYKRDPVPGFHMPLGWKGKRPETNQVAVFIRVQTDEVNRLESEAILQLGPPGDESATWVPNPLGSQSAFPRFDRQIIWR